MKTSEDLLKELLAGIVARDWIEKFELLFRATNTLFSILNRLSIKKAANFRFISLICS